MLSSSKDLSESGRRSVEIHLSTTINQAGNASHFNFAMPGKMFRMGSTVYLRFKEKDQKGQPPVPMTLRIDPQGYVNLERNVPGHAMHLYFIQGREVPAKYETPYGSMKLETRTSLVEFQTKDQPYSGDLKIDYALANGSQILGTYELRLQFTV